LDPFQFLEFVASSSEIFAAWARGANSWASDVGDSQLIAKAGFPDCNAGCIVWSIASDAELIDLISLVRGNFRTRGKRKQGVRAWGYTAHRFLQLRVVVSEVNLALVG
jgi:hypothetical protein